MRLISTEYGQSLQLIVMDEVRPLRGGTYLPDLISSVAQRYRFVSYPTDFAAAAQQGAKFQTGVIELGGIVIPITGLEIYNDGIIVTTSNTDDSDTVFDDFAGWAIQTFNLREPTTKIPRRHASNVVVDFDVSLSSFIRNFELISKLISSAFATTTGISHDLHVARLSIGADPATSRVAQVQSTLTLEPRGGQPFTSNRYFSGAPLRTQEHLDLLGALERSVGLN
jgi:hypothetical protein